MPSKHVQAVDDISYLYELGADIEETAAHLKGCAEGYEKLLGEVERWKAEAALYRHVYACAQCQGPDDGCDTGGALESRCIDELKFDPYHTGEGS